MKTKHLLFATALVASFASCTNEEIVEQQGVANVERPTVENVKLNFVSEGVDSRLAFGSKGYAWEASDVIGALLMDQPVATTSKLWESKYTLTNWVNTSYPFAYNAETKVWSNDAKMLEGNYFFAFPFSSYNGGREVKHSLTEQAQAGVASKAVAESYAKNQFFVGYSQIFGGTEAEDALEDVEMTSILGGLQFRIINNGSKTYHINKLVVRGTQVASELQLTPDHATDNTKDFNYAMYVGDDKASADLWNKEKYESETFDRAELIRDIVVDADDVAGKAQLNVNGTKAERAIAKGATGYAVVMVNPFEVPETKDSNYELVLDIYTDEGVIANIDLTTPITDAKKQAAIYEGFLIDKAVAEVAHDVANTIVIKFTDEALESIQSAEIYDGEDLLQLIEWNAKSDIKIEATATLVKDVAFTQEMFDLLKSNKNVTLNIVNAVETISEETAEVETPVLTLAEDLDADVLSYEGLNIAADVELAVAGTIEAAEDDEDKTEVEFLKMTILEGAVLNVNNADPVLPKAIINEGTINFGEKTIAVVTLTNEEEGIINIAKGADVKGADNTKFVNNGTINNNGYLEHIANNEDAVIVLGEKATLKDLDNKAEATVNTAKDAQIIGKNAGLINWVTGATVNLSSNTGMVSAEAPASVAKDAYKDSFINTLRLKENTVTTFASDEPGATLNIIAAKGATLKVANGEDLTLGTLIVEKDLTIVTNNTTGTTASSLTVGTVKIAEGAELTNNGKLIVSTSWTNEGIVYNNGAANLYHNATPGTFKYAQPTYGDAPASPTTPALKTMVSVWWANVTANNGEVFNDHVNRDNLSMNPYDVNKFAAFIINNANWDGASGVGTFKSGVATFLANDSWKLNANLTTEAEKIAALTEKLEANYSDFESYITEIVVNVTAPTGDNLAAEVAKYIDAKTGAIVNTLTRVFNVHDNNVYASKNTAMKAAIAKLIGAGEKNLTTFNAKKVAYKILGTDALYTALGKTNVVINSVEETANFQYVWAADTCPLYEVVNAADEYKLSDWNKVWDVADADKIANDVWSKANIKKWINNASIYGGTTEKTIAKKYYNKPFDYSNEQVTAVANKLAE